MRSNDAILTPADVERIQRDIRWMWVFLCGMLGGFLACSALAIYLAMTAGEAI